MLQELDKESLLLLYVADELSSADRAEVDAMLESDTALRALLNGLEGTIEVFDVGMAQLDAIPLLSESAAVWRIGQAMRQRLTEQAAPSVSPAPAEQPRLKYPWWAYPSVAAAVVLICFVSWWGNRPDQPLKLPADGPGVIAHTGPAGQTSPSDESTQLAEDIKQSFDMSNPTQPAKSVASLDAAESQIAELSRTQADFRYSDGNE
jgi:hypothetical protein